MSFWRKFGKVILVISIIACLGLVIFLGMSQRYIGMVERTMIMLGGVILVLAVHTILGMFIEMCDNIAEIKEKAENNNTSPSRASSYMNGSR